MLLAYPLRTDACGLTVLTDEERHVRDLIEQVLFTAKGERVNRPSFGTDVRRLVFAGNSDPAASATQFLVKAALHEWLGDVIEVSDLEVEHIETQLLITIRYKIRKSGVSQTATFSRSF